MELRNLTIIIVALSQSSPLFAWRMTRKLSRRDWFDNLTTTSTSTVAALVTTLAPIGPFDAHATYMDAKTGTLLPELGEISNAIPRDWGGVENPLDGNSKALLGRLDTTPDSVFYSDPRFVEHVDENAVRTMTEFITTRAVKNGDSVLDLCSSWTSHLDTSKVVLKRMAGLGMNEKELSANGALTDWTVSDLNIRAILPYDDESFSVVLCQLSIDYLTQPLQVLKEVGRVLKPGGKVYILFSNRLFIQKAVALWTGADDIDHAYTVGCYLHFGGGGFKEIQAEDLSTRKGNRIVGDPLYVVSGIKP